MPPLNDLIAELTQYQANLVQMGAIKNSKNQALVATNAPKSSGKDKEKGMGKFLESTCIKFNEEGFELGEEFLQVAEMNWT